MPTYVYEVILDSGESGERFEVFQSMSDATLTEHPETGQPVRRVVLAPNIIGKHNLSGADRALKDDKKLDKLGFTKYVKTDDGKYEKTAGKGPKNIESPSP